MQQKACRGNLLGLARILSNRCFSSAPSELAVQSSTSTDLNRVLTRFDAPIRFCAAYGSAVYPQQTKPTTGSSASLATSEPPLVDFIFGVTHPQHWHSLNLRQYPQHYSFLRLFGSRAVQLIQTDFGAHIYYNTNCEVAGKKIKYGVISVEELIADLEDWETLYCAGRLHKPVKIIQNDARVQIAQKMNLKSAVRTAQLLLPDSFSDQELFMKIASLSYTGDFRMRFAGEDPYKVRNIVYNQMNDFRELYRVIIDELDGIEYTGSSDVLQQDVSVKARKSILRVLPLRFRENLIRHQVMVDGGYLDAEDKTKHYENLAQSSDLPQKVHRSLSEIIWQSSISQAIKGIFTAGLTDSFKYARRKLAKGSSAAAKVQ